MTKNNLLYDLKYYSTQLFKETAFLVFLALDIIGALVTYFASLTVPYWLFIVTLVVGIFWGGFNIYRKGTADIRVEISDQPDSLLCVCLSKDDLLVDLSVSGYLVNFGAQSGVLENITPHLWANGIKDDYVLSRMYTYQMLPLHKGKVHPHLLHEGKYQKNDGHFEFPIALSPGKIEPFTIGIRLKIITRFTQDKMNAFEGFINWLDCYELSLSYTVRQNDGSHKRETRVKIPKAILKDTISNSSDL